MNREIVFIVYVSDIEASVRFYRDLLGLDTEFESPRYVTFSLGEGVSLALWTGKADALEGAPTRTSEVCLNVDAPRVMETFNAWTSQGVEVIEDPHEDVFGITFVVADPDGNRIRVAPID